MSSFELDLVGFGPWAVQRDEHQRGGAEQTEEQGGGGRGSEGQDMGGGMASKMARGLANRAASSKKFDKVDIRFTQIA